MIFLFSKQSFLDIEMWLKELKTHANPDIKVFLIGNKIDLEEHRKISQEDAKKFKDDFMLNLYMETSAKTGFNAKEIFIEAARVLFKEYNKYKKIDEEKKIKLPKLSEQDPNTVIEKKNCNWCNSNDFCFYYRRQNFIIWNKSFFIVEIIDFISKG